MPASKSSKRNRKLDAIANILANDVFKASTVKALKDYATFTSESESRAQRIGKDAAICFIDSELVKNGTAYRKMIKDAVRQIEQILGTPESTFSQYWSYVTAIWKYDTQAVEQIAKGTCKHSLRSLYDAARKDGEIKRANVPMWQQQAQRVSKIVARLNKRDAAKFWAALDTMRS